MVEGKPTAKPKKLIGYNFSDIFYQEEDILTLVFAFFKPLPYR